MTKVADPYTAAPQLMKHGELQTTALEIEDGKVTAIYVTRNPDKLRHMH